MRICESCYSNLERLPERAETDSFNRNCGVIEPVEVFKTNGALVVWLLENPMN